MFGIRRAMAEVDAAMGRIVAMEEGWEIEDGIGHG
jgi:hypothetical protein